MKKIYSKFTKERKKEYQIETALYEDNLMRYIDKIALNEEAKPHVNKMSELFNDGSIREYLCPVKKIDDGHVRFIFLEGEAISERLINCLKKRDVDGVKLIAKDYREIFDAVQKKYINLDLSFDNIIYSKNQSKYLVIDYEWIIDDISQKEYSAFRAVNSFFVKNSDLIKQCISFEEFYKLFGLDVSLLEKYMHNEDEFNNRIFGSNDESYNSFLACYEKELYDIKRLYNHSNYIQFYFDGIGETINPDEYKYPISKGVTEYGVEVPKGEIKAIRVDPVDAPFSCENLHIFVQLVDDSIVEVIDYDYNAYQYDETCFFYSEDPQIIFDNKWGNDLYKIIIDYNLLDVFNCGKNGENYFREIEKMARRYEESILDLEIKLDKKTEYSKKLLYIKKELGDRVNLLAAENLLLKSQD